MKYDISIDQLCHNGYGYDEHYLPIWCSQCAYCDSCADSPFQAREDEDE